MEPKDQKGVKAPKEEPKTPKKEPKKASKKENIDFNLDKENKYLVAGFKASKQYKKELTGRELKEAFQKYKKKGAEIK